MGPSEIGARTELAVMAAIASTGHRVLLPFSSYLRFDTAFEFHGRLVKVQCKTGRELKGAVVFETADRTVGVGRDYRDDAELFGVYCHGRQEAYLVPVIDVPRRSASLRLTAPRNNQKAGIRMADQYLVRDGRLPDAVLQAFSSSPGNSPARTRGNPPSRLTSSFNRHPLDRQMSMFECTLGSTDVDIGDDMAIPVQLAADEVAVACCTPLAAPRIDEASAQATAALFKALADPHRVRIVNLLANQDDAVCVCDVTAYLGLSQSTVSFHLKKLVNAGLLTREQRGTWGFYAIDPAAMTTLRDVVEPKGVSV